MTEAYLSATFGPNISDFFDLCLHWVSVVLGQEDAIFENPNSEILPRSYRMPSFGGIWENLVGVCFSTDPK